LDTAAESNVEVDVAGASPLSSQKASQDCAVSRKMMAAVFWDVYRDLLVDFTPRGSTINGDAYEETQKRLRRLFGKRDQDVDRRSSYA
jgi:hypothetical protein